jgi:hypothetical protein
MNRRESLKLLAIGAPAAAGFTWNAGDVARAGDQAARTVEGAFAPDFFTEHEYRTVSILADLILPADDRSGSATDAGVPAFMDFMMIDRPDMQLPMRGGLAWIDHECTRRYGKTFADCDESQRKGLLDDIAWPERAEPSLSHGVRFFNSFRDLTASGFWSSKIGVEDLRYLGNTVVPEWQGCPEEALQRLGVSYDE